jgi:hypothetical protein
MPSLLYRINHYLSRVVSNVSVGTNLGLFYLLGILLRGRLLQSRGGVIPALAAFGLAAASRATGVGRTGVWTLEHRVPAGCLAAGGARRWSLAGAPAWGLLANDL